MLITLDEARAHLNLGEDETEDDALIQGYIAAAAQHFESRYGIVVDRAERSWSFDRFARLMLLPATSFVIDSLAISYVDAAGVEQELPGVRCIAQGKHFRLAPAIGAEWPSTICEPGAVTVTCQAGYAADAEASEGIPDDIKVAGKLLVGHWYMNREGVGRDMSELPLSVSALLGPYDLPRV